MPGPSNARKKKKAQNKKDKHAKLHTSTGESASNDSSFEADRHPHTSADVFPDFSRLHVLSPSPDSLYSQEPLPLPDARHEDTEESEESDSLALETYDATFALLQQPIIYDPGNGPRVQDVRAFLSSPFSQPACSTEPLCAEFAQPEVLQMLLTVLPEETALFLWYNKSRRIGRVCPSCRRLYNLGDTLPDAVQDTHGDPDAQVEKPPSPLLYREQHISGLCSPLCFILAAFNCPGAIRAAWGRMAEELDDATWAQLNSVGASAGAHSDHGLGMLLRMTRLHDLGLAQLCTPEIEAEESDAQQWYPSVAVAA
ncbi:hypothetical protein EWM64_g1906 [Hericium alpestre]|uniref:Uncharacterized protein n=1 Tax=Hericium alpestre TaxID=135208 RepID=A0A4Z0A4Y3_9AGAM|nr:hypothetical protein EWM64_g1906 [Hericium alpestre]